MRMWLLLTATIIAEVTGSLALSAAQQYPPWYIVTAIGYFGSFWLLMLVLRAGMPLGVAYGIWSASGVALTALGGAALFGDALTRTMMAGIALIIPGVLLVHTGSERARSALAAAPSTTPSPASPTSSVPGPTPEAMS